MKATVLRAKRWHKELLRRKKRERIARTHPRFYKPPAAVPVQEKPAHVDPPAAVPKKSRAESIRSAVKSFLRRTP
jgi:hypothetical protein